MCRYSLLLMILICNMAVEAKKIPGYFITKSNETKMVTFDVITDLLGNEIRYNRIQNKIHYFDSTNIKQTLKPDMASEFVIMVNGDSIRFLSRENNLRIGSLSKGKRIFLRIIKDGHLKLFKVYETQSTSKMNSGASNTVTWGSNLEEKYVLQKNNDTLFSSSGVTFRKKMTAYLSDCPDVVNKIKSKQYRIVDMPAIVDEYNFGCK